MGLTEEEVNEHAKRLIELHNNEYEFSLVYEDEELEDLGQREWERIFEAMYEANVEVTFDD